METLQMKSRCELNTRLRPHATQHGLQQRAPPLAAADAIPARTASRLPAIRLSARVVDVVTEASPVERSSGAAGPGEFPGLEAFLTEHRAPLCRLKGHRRFLATG